MVWLNSYKVQNELYIKYNSKIKKCQKKEVYNMIYKFTSRAKKAIELAQDEAVSLGHNYIGTEHVLYGLIKEGAGVASRVLQNQGITAEDVEAKIVEIIKTVLGNN